LGPIEALEVLLLTETLRLLISFSNIICGIHLEKVKPALSTLVLEVMRAYLNYSLISSRITPSFASSVHIFSHLLLLLLDVLFLPDLTLAQAASLLYVLNISGIILTLRAMIIAHCRWLFIQDLISGIPFNDVLSQVLFKKFLLLIDKGASLLINLLKEHLNASFLLSVDLLSDLLTFFFSGLFHHFCVHFSSLCT
jgi:hypothetical protein